MAKTNFMSLPPELRIRIYEYALDPLADPGVASMFLWRQGHTDGRCCAVSLRNIHRRCDCAQNKITTGLLRANKQIFAEAIEVLGSLFELRVRIPGNAIGVNAKELATVVEKIPQYARKHMRQLLLVSPNASSRDFEDYHDYDDRSFRTHRPDALAGLDKYWKTIKQELPQLRQLRIHIDLTKSELQNIKYVLWAFKGTKTLPKLQLFRLEIHQRHQVYGEPAWSDWFMEETQADLICKLMKFVEGTFEIDLQLIEKEPPTPEQQWRTMRGL
ncbi:hypothetical protein PRZ48_011496 [Zasmidium cellare]|uniref:Uncharacterized protein n=1 Tax=Zasmidium cellare TaxID=395010 RepID=A0ABR0E6K0_ZASCE|nr:hypothetical protein PRZ48_011496 [Zasmidium cellare]